MLIDRYENNSERTMPFYATMSGAVRSNGVNPPFSSPASVSFVAMGAQFGVFNVAAVTGAASYTVNIYYNSTRSTTGGTLARTVTSSSNSNIATVSLGGNGEIFYGNPNYYYLTATATSAGGSVSLPVTSSQICTFYSYSGSASTWTAPATVTATISLSGGGGTDGTGGNGGMMVCSYAVTNGTSYTISVGGPGRDPGTSFGAGGVTGGSGTYSGGSMSQFDTVMYAGGGGASGSGNQGSVGNGGNGGTLGLNGSGGVGQDGFSGSRSTTTGAGGKGATQSVNGRGGAGGGAGTAGTAGSGTAGYGQGGNGGEAGGGGGGAGYFAGGGGGGCTGGTYAAGGGGGGSSYTTETVLNVLDFTAGVYAGSSSTAAPFNGLVRGLAYGQSAGGGACAIVW